MSLSFGLIGVEIKTDLLQRSLNASVVCSASSLWWCSGETWMDESFTPSWPVPENRRLAPPQERLPETTETSEEEQKLLVVWRKDLCIQAQSSCLRSHWRTQPLAWSQKKRSTSTWRIWSTQNLEEDQVSPESVESFNQRFRNFRRSLTFHQIVNKRFQTEKGIRETSDSKWSICGPKFWC